MKIAIAACLKDNYAYMVTCENTGASVIVDACEAGPVLAACEALPRRPDAIWSTHHHPDHTGANEEVAKALEIVEIVAHASDRGRVPGQTRFVEENDTLAVGELSARVLHIPGHTTGAIAYVVEGQGSRAVFTGDTLFVAGCGRLFEGTPEMMFASLAKLAALADDTLVYCGHEYTEANLRFARHVEPDNAAVARAIDEAAAARAQGKPTVPSTIGGERGINPFLRAKDVAQLAARRAAKDTFKG